jgi:hypothetical protein
MARSSNPSRDLTVPRRVRGRRRASLSSVAASMMGESRVPDGELHRPVVSSAEVVATALGHPLLGAVRWPGVLRRVLSSFLPAPLVQDPPIVDQVSDAATRAASAFRGHGVVSRASDGQRLAAGSTREVRHVLDESAPPRCLRRVCLPELRPIPPLIDATWRRRRAREPGQLIAATESTDSVARRRSIAVSADSSATSTHERRPENPPAAQ